MNVDRLFHVAAPHLHLLVATSHQACDLAWSLQRTPDRQAVVRTIRGAKSPTAGQLFDEVSAALQFPYYFGENWDALDECLADLEWLTGGAYILVFTESELLLDQEPVGQFALLVDVLENAAHEWAHARRQDSPRAPRPFHVIFQCEATHEEAFLARMNELGRSLNRLQ